jgi:hypothetical protein
MNRCSALGDVRFTPNSDRKSGLPRQAMSALAKSRLCGALADVCYGPKADMTITGEEFNQLAVQQPDRGV